VSAFLAGRGFSVGDPGEAVTAFVDPGLRRARAVADELSGEQRALAGALDDLRGAHDALPAAAVGPETPGTEGLLRREELATLREQVRAFEASREDVLGSRTYRWSAPVRRLADSVGRLRRRR
jgi:hypothetical protein